MRLPMILFSAFVFAALVGAGVAESKTAGAKKASPSQTASTTSQAMYECQALYAGPRGFLGRDRYGYIEGCFKAKTGMYPFQAHENCTLRRC